MVAGDVGRVDIRIEHVGTVPSVSFELSETVGRPRAVAVHRSPPGAADGRSGVHDHRIPAHHHSRGIVRLGPLIVENRDPLGIARTRTLLLDVDEVFVAPRSYLLDMPQLGQGICSAPTCWRWRGASGRVTSTVCASTSTATSHGRSTGRHRPGREQLLVKEHTTEGLRRCTVVLDARGSGYSDPEAFERAVTAAASLVHSADRAGLTTRFVTADGVDLRGPDVAQQTLRLLAGIGASDATLGSIEHDPGEGLGLLIVVGAGSGALAARIHAMLDPTQTAITVSTERAPGRSLDVAGAIGA